MELLGCDFGETIIMHLPHTDRVHQLDAGQDDASTPEILEAHHWFDDAFAGAVILVHDVIQVLVLAYLDRCRPPGVERLECGQIGAAFIHANRVGLTVLVNRLLKVAARSGLVTMGARNRKSTVLPCLYTLQLLPTARLCHPNAFSNNGTSLMTQRCTLE
ncbi:hypothetical protein LMG29542_08722 [Paraburkholderia humisilvae]|uniref:Uncharacterized protein n=1 Tax=Paraburkholderia humisilvae TaxID=627669 RepID=A0A6J5F907_9BURK|nr:hypothetical protein LMG29542_08722 [Paraburkholderia humisilvae]